MLRNEPMLGMRSLYNLLSRVAKVLSRRYPKAPVLRRFQQVEHIGLACPLDARSLLFEILASCHLIFFVFIHYIRPFTFGLNFAAQLSIGIFTESSLSLPTYHVVL